VSFEIVHRDPDPHRGQELHERKPPVEDEQPHAVEEHHECADGENERGKYPPGLAECPDRVFDHLLVAGLEIVGPPHQWAPERREAPDPTSGGDERALPIRLSDHAPVEALFATPGVQAANP